MKHLLSLGLFFLSAGQPAVEAASAIYAATPYGPYKSIDNGASWTFLTVSVSTPLLQGTPKPIDIAVDPKNPSTVYFVGLVGNTNGFFRSTNGGQTWSAVVLQGFGGAPVRTPIVIDPVDTRNIYLVSGLNGVRSRDGGLSFTTLTLPTVSAQSITPDPNLPGVLLLTSPYFVSVDFGDTWFPLYKPSDFAVSGFNIGPVVFDPCNPQLVYIPNPFDFSKCIPVIGSPFNCGVEKSVDGGLTFKPVNFPGGVHNLSFDRTTGAIYGGAYYTGTGPSVIKSTDKGETFTPLYNDFVSLAPSVYVDPSISGTVYAFGNQTALKQYVKSSDGGLTWKVGTLPGLCNVASQCPSTFPSPEIYDFAFAAAPALLTNVSAADYQICPVAPASIVSAFGSHLSVGQAQGQSPLSTTLSGTTVQIIDANGTSHPAPLFLVSPTQVNYLVPAGTASGTATVTIKASDGTATTGTVQIAPVAPGLFTLNGSQLVAANVLRVSNGQQSFEAVYQVDSSGAVVARPIDLGPAGDQVYLLLYGTGIAGAGTTNTTARVAGFPSTVSYAGPQGTYEGLDQVNVLVPSFLTGAGYTTINLSAAGVGANAVRIMIK